MAQPSRRRTVRKPPSRAGNRPAAARPAERRQRTPRTESGVNIMSLLTRNPSATVLAGLIIGGITRRRWIFLSSLAAWLLLQDRDRAG